MPTEDDNPTQWVKYILIIVANIIFLFFIVFAYMSKWIALYMLFIAVGLNVFLYIVIGVIALIKNQFGSHLESELKQSALADKQQAKQYTLEMCKKEYSTLIQITHDMVIHIGPDTHRTPMYVMYGKDRYSTKEFSVATRLDNLSQSVVYINTPKDEFMKNVRQLAEANPNEEEKITNYYDEVSGHLVRTERETRTTPIMQQQQIEAEKEKKIEVGG
jgi:hypothetical protein